MSTFCPYLWRILACWALFYLAACAGHADRTLKARTALDAGQPKQALAIYNEELGVESAAALPEDVSGDNALLLLDRSMILQQLGEYEFSSRDLQLADKQIELLDFSRSALDSLGKYMFSDDTGPYKAPPYEKLMINTMNMVNYLARGDLNGARVEARRLAVIQKYLSESESPAIAMMGPGSYLAGFTFEKSGRADQALRYYDEALQFGDYQSLKDPVRRLSGMSGYSTPRLEKLLGSDSESEKTAGPNDESGEIFVIVNFGRVPAKFAERIPIGLALTYASGWLSPMDRQRANKLALQGLVTWVNYPELGKSRGTYDTPGFALDGNWQVLEGALAVDREVRSAYEHARGAIVASAITRMISRVVAGSVAQKAAGDKGGGALGLLLSLGTQATLTAADTPDTRSWATLPARMAFSRVRVKPGKHKLVLSARGYKRSQTVNIEAGGFQVVALTVLE